MKRHNTLHGYYLPSFFLIQLEVENKLENINLLPEEDQATFIHEYIHFLQDITTTFGLKNICKTADLLLTLSDSVKKENNSSFTTPVQLPPNSKGELESELYSLFIGTEEIQGKLKNIICIDIIENEVILNFEQEPIVRIKYFESTSHTIKEFYFGADCIIESMAYLIESSLFVISNQSVFPYQIVQKVVDFIYPDLALDKRNLIALCDISLNVYNPGFFMINVLKEFKKINLKIQNPKELYSICKNIDLKVNSNIYNYQSLYFTWSPYAEKDLARYFTLDIFEPLRKWTEFIISEARKIKKKNFSILMDILEPESMIERRKLFIDSYIQELGIPLLTNSKSQFYFYNKNLKLDQSIILLRAINEVHNVLMGHQSNCLMKKCCQINFDEDITNKECDISPWNRSKDEKLCAFAIIWKMWGLSGKSVKKE